MPTLTFTASFSKNTGLLFSAQEIRTSYLYGIKMNSSLSNQISLAFSDEDIEFHVRAAQTEIANYLGVKLFRDIHSETQDFSNDDWRYWGFMKTSFQVVCPLELTGKLVDQLETTYPQNWLSIKKDSDDIQYHRNIHIVPSGNSGAISNSALFAGLIPNLGYMTQGHIPNYWNITYVTGFDGVPNDIMMAIGQMATISLLAIAGANVLGIPGISGISLSIDGLSQSLTSALNAFGERAKAYSEDLQRKLPNLVGTYRGINWSSC